MTIDGKLFGCFENEKRFLKTKIVMNPKTEHFISAIIEEVKEKGIEKVFNKKHFKELYKKYCIDDKTEYEYILKGEWKKVEK